MKQRITLNENTLRTVFAHVPCPECGVTVIVADLELDDICHCRACDRPLVIRANDGLWYYIGEKVFE